MKHLKIFLFLIFLSKNIQAQTAEFNPLKDMQTIPNAARITVMVGTTPLGRVVHAAILVDDVCVADGDTENPPTIEVEAGKEFLLAVCPLNNNGNLIKPWCRSGGLIRPSDNTLYKFNFQIYPLPISLVITERIPF